MRRMYDAADPGSIPRLASFQGVLIAYYTTGGPGQNWAGHVNDFPGAIMVPIDQASAPGAPNYNAVVQDVEPGAYAVSDVPGWTSQCTQPRPTVYCDRNDYPGVRSVWSGAIWLAAPGVTTPPDPKVIAIQNIFSGPYDRSDVFDDTWPYGAKEMLNGMLNPGEQKSIPFPRGSFREVLLYHDFNTGPTSVRVAVHSVSRGYAQIDMHDITHSVPESVTFDDTDVDGVSLSNVSSVSVGYTLS